MDGSSAVRRGGMDDQTVPQHQGNGWGWMAHLLSLCGHKEQKGDKHSWISSKTLAHFAFGQNKWPELSDRGPHMSAHCCTVFVSVIQVVNSYKTLWGSFVSVQKVVSVWVQVSLRLKPRLVANRKFAWEINDSKNSRHKELLSYKPRQKVISKVVESLCSSLSTVPCACHVCLKPIWCFDGTKSCNPTSNLLDS